MSTHTPGAWAACEPGDYSDYDGNCIVVLGYDSSIRVAVVLGTSEESIANARLIAAASSMLNALEGVVRVANRATVEFDAARAAIAKGTGRRT